MQLALGLGQLRCVNERHLFDDIQIEDNFAPLRRARSHLRLRQIDLRLIAWLLLALRWGNLGLARGSREG
jgi:hypothetical protein